MEMNLNKDNDCAAFNRRCEADGALPFWPILLDREQLSAYVGVSADTLGRICPVAPVSLGVKLLRWRRPDIDSWIMGLPARLLARKAEQPTPQPHQLAGEERRASAMESVRLRSKVRTESGRWNAPKKSASFNA